MMIYYGMVIYYTRWPSVELFLGPRTKGVLQEAICPKRGLCFHFRGVKRDILVANIHMPLYLFLLAPCLAAYSV